MQLPGTLYLYIIISLVSARYESFACKAFVTVHLVSDAYTIVRSDMVHSHSFQAGKPWLYVNNRRLSATDEAHVFQLMSSFKNVGEMQKFALTTYHKRLERHDVYSIRKRHSRDVKLDEGVLLRNLLTTEGKLEVVEREGLVRFVYFIPSTAENLCEKYADVILADATHRLNRGGYALWHAMLVDETGFSHTFFTLCCQTSAPAAT